MIQTETATNMEIDLGHDNIAGENSHLKIKQKIQSIEINLTNVVTIFILSVALDPYQSIESSSASTQIQSIQMTSNHCCLNDNSNQNNVYSNHEEKNQLHIPLGQLSRKRRPMILY